MISAAMADYDLTQRMAPYLDRHLELPLLDFLQERQVHPDQKILLRKMEVLTNTRMIDYSWSVHKALFNSEEVPNYILEKKAEGDAMLRALEGWVAPMTRFLQNAHSLQHLTGDRDYNLTMLYHCYKIGPDQIHALYEYGVFQFECGNYSVVTKYFDNYIPLSTKKELQFSALWGKLAAAILMKNWNTALVDFYRLKKIIDLEHLFESATDVVQTKVGLVHWSLFVFFNHDDGIAHVIDLFNQDKYFNVIQTNAPYLLRYLAVAFIITKSRKPQFENFIKVVQSGQCSYKDPITEFFTCLYVNDNFNDAEMKLEKCVEVILSDPFLGKRCEDGRYSLRDEFLLSAGCFIFDNYCKTHQPIEISALAMRLNSTREDTESCTTIQDSELDAGIDTVPEPNHSNVSKNALSTITKNFGNDGEGQTIFESSKNSRESGRQVCQNQHINYTPSLTFEDSSSNAIAPPNLIIPTIYHENQELTASIFQPLPLSDSQPMAGLLSSQGIGSSPLASTYLLDVGLHQNDIANYGSLHGRTVANTEVGGAYLTEQGMKVDELPRNYEQVNSNKVNDKRKRNIVTPSGDGKHCSCHKSQCLKLLYCGETCSCKECINRPEYEEIVHKKCAMIEIRNQNAFTPDLVPRHREPSQYGGTQLDLTNAKHKSGCGCKKSQCQKNYCECYQANVKCSEGCRCVGCKNTYNSEEGVPKFS